MPSSSTVCMSNPCVCSCCNVAERALPAAHLDGHMSGSCALQVHDYLRPLMLKDLRTQCRARGINPGGSREALAERVGEHMLATQDL